MNNWISWAWYTFGILLTLVWKWQRFCYEAKGAGVPFWKSSGVWFETVTLGSRISWAVTLGIVWVIGSVVITKTGAGWLFGGVFMDMPVAPPFLFLIGALAEMTLPALAKWICSKIPGADHGYIFKDSRGQP
jgi:hypothetical protein